jgi:ABC-type Mn2+/Zn2+ transport system permease subunit
MYLSFYLDISSAATIVLTAAAVFLVLELLLWFRRQPQFSTSPVDRMRDLR